MESPGFSRGEEVKRFTPAAWWFAEMAYAQWLEHGDAKGENDA